jgi:hypothetical protein
LNSNYEIKFIIYSNKIKFLWISKVWTWFELNRMEITKWNCLIGLPLQKPGPASYGRGPAHTGQRQLARQGVAGEEAWSMGNRFVVVGRKGALQGGWSTATKSVVEEAQRRGGPMVTSGEGVAGGRRGTPGNLLEVVARPDEDGAWWSTVTHAEEDGSALKSVARLRWPSARVEIWCLRMRVSGRPFPHLGQWQGRVVAASDCEQIWQQAEQSKSGGVGAEEAKRGSSSIIPRF